MDPNMLAAAAAAANAAHLVALDLLDSPSRKRKKDHRSQPRAKRRLFHCDEALMCIQRDYIGSPTIPDSPLFGADFKMMFRLSRSRFQKLLEDVMATDTPFYKKKKFVLDENQSSIYAKLMLPLKCLAYGVPPHTFIDYFQMSKAYARDCCIAFDKIIKKIYLLGERSVELLPSPVL